MNKVLGIMAEYDPFHNGHAYMLKRAADIVEETYGCSEGDVTRIAVISGEFTQRGEPALTDKWSRAEMAIRQGFDLVAEIPFVFCCNNSGYFAKASVEILESLGADVIAFGSETDHLQTLLNAAHRRANITEEQQTVIKSLVKEGRSYPSALSEALDETEPFGPNDSLGIEYIRHMKKAVPIPVKRIGADHNSTEENSSISSASLIRQKLLNGEPLEDVSHLIPSSTLELLKRESEACGFCSPDMIFSIIAAKAAVSSDEELNAVYGAEEGLGSKLRSEFRYASGWDDLTQRLKSKRYTMTRVQRVLIHIITGITRETVKRASPYIRILALNDRGAAHLKAVKKTGISGLPFIDNIKSDLKVNPQVKSAFEKGIMATDLYNIALGRDLYSYSDYVKNPLKF